MNKNAIWGIIGLMSIALIGIIALQAYWINERLRLEETYFDNQITTILNKVGEKLDKDEKDRISQMVWNADNLTKNLFKNDTNDDYGSDIGLGLGFFSKKHSFDTLSGYGSKHTNTLECNCIACKQAKHEATEWMREKWLSTQLNNPDPIEERIRVNQLDSYVKQELLNNNIDLDYTYGIYSRNKKAFVIRDGKYNYVPGDEDDFGSQAVSVPVLTIQLDDNKELLNSKYSLRLFNHSAGTSSGDLMIHFPGKIGYVWGTVLSTVIAAILFTSIILFCFIYTIQVIFTQKKLSKIKSDFINNMTHEFKTPIATISLASDSITSPMISGNPQKVKRFANIIKQENRRMNMQVEKVLQMALLDKNDIQLKFTQVDAHEVIRQAVNNINLRAESRDGNAKAVLNAANSFVEADLTHFSNVVNNLLDNAYKYSPEKPEIMVTTENKSNGINIKIKDNGIGMAKDDQKHIFDKFFRVHTGNLHDVKGFGLGLSYVKAILNAHKGQISVKSELGKGSEFTLFFPYINSQQGN
jgi:two-component system phosphate regulon sensor histidine kinase PhoR